jgi:hypothetical protein
MRMRLTNEDLQTAQPTEHWTSVQQNSMAGHHGIYSNMGTATVSHSIYSVVTETFELRCARYAALDCLGVPRCAQAGWILEMETRNSG